MHRKQQLHGGSLRLLIETIPESMRKALELLVLAEKSLIIGELLEAIDYQASINTLYNWLGRFERKGLVKNNKIFMASKKAWKLEPPYKSNIMGVLSP